MIRETLFKRLCIICFLSILMLVNSIIFLPASYADVVFGNEFFYENRDKTEPVDENYRWNWRAFVVNSPAGSVYAKDEPGLEYKEGNRLFNNGDIVYIEATYNLEGEYWGVMQTNHSYMFPGWVPMEELLLVFQQHDFESLNKDSFYNYTGSFDAVLSAKRLVEWEWPGSDREKRIYNDKEIIARHTNVQYAYLDKDGREWGKTSYNNNWVCLSDPENSKIPAFYLALEPTRWSPDYNYDWFSDRVRFPAQDSQGDPPDDPEKFPPPSTIPPEDPSQNGFFKAVPIIILVIALVAGTVVLAIRFRKSGRGK